MNEREQVTAAEFNISNANEYFNELKREGICKGEWNDTHTFKWWYIIDYEKAKRYIRNEGEPFKANRPHPQQAV
jgi:hypothetical protein